MGIHNSFGFHQEHKGLRNPEEKKPTKSNMKVFTTVCAMVGLASAESQLLIAQNDVNYLRSPNVGKMRYKGYVDYVDTSSSTHPLVNNYVFGQPQITLGQPQVETQYTSLEQPQAISTQFTTPYHGFQPVVTMRFRREAEAEATHAQRSQSKVSNPDGSSYEYEVQVNRDGEGQSFQHHEQKQQTNEQRIEEQLYHNMMNARNMEEIQRFNEIMTRTENKNRFGTEQNQFGTEQNRFEHNRQQQQYTRDFGQNRQNQILNQLFNNPIQNQRSSSFNRFFQLQQQRPQYSHRLINSKNNQQRQQYIREKLNNFGMKKDQNQESGSHRMFKRAAEPTMVTYSIAPATPPTPIMSFDTLRNNIYSHVDDINSLNNYRRVVYQLKPQPMAYRQASLNAESMKEIHPEGTMSLRKAYNNDIYQLGRNYGYESMVDMSNSH